MSSFEDLRDRLEGFLYKNIWSRFEKIGPNTVQEAHQIHLGVWKGLVRIWTPRGLYREMMCLAEKYPDSWEKKDKHYQIGLLASSFSLKWVGVYFWIELMGNSVFRSALQVCGGLML